MAPLDLITKTYTVEVRGELTSSDYNEPQKFWCARVRENPSSPQKGGLSSHMSFHPDILEGILGDHGPVKSGDRFIITVAKMYP
jgi:hypothetical protein